MRVGLIVAGGVDRSGRERVIPALLWLIERLARRHDLHVFVLHQEQQPCTYSLLGATIHDLGRVNAAPGLAWRRQLARLNAALMSIERVNVLHGYWVMPAGFVTTMAARDLRVPCVVTADSGEWAAIPDIGYGLARRWLDRRRVSWTMQNASRITVCSEQMAAMAGRHGIQTSVIPLGVAREAFPAVGRTDGPLWRLLHVASINPVKDQTTLLQAMARVVADEPDVRLDIVGEDTLGGRMQRLAESLNLGAHVHFHGFLPTDQVAGFFARAHLHVVSSRHEAAGVVTLEAGAAGVPTVGTAVGYIADGSPERAVAVPVHDLGALAEAIVAVLRDPARRIRIAAAAQAWALAHDADWTASEFSHLYETLAVESHAR